MLQRSLVVGVLAVAAVAMVISRPATGPAAGDLDVALAIGSVAVMSGTEVLVRGWTGGAEAVFRRWLGVTMVVWGGGQLVKCSLAVAGTTGFPAYGDLIQFAAAPIAIAGVVTIPRAVGGSFPVLRIGLDGGLLAICGSLLLWVFWRPQITAHSESRVTAALMLLFEMVFTTMAVVIAVRDLEVPLIVLALGFFSFTVGDLILLTSRPEAVVPKLWIGQVLWMLCAPTIAWGALNYHPGSRNSDDTAPIDVDPDARMTVVTTTSSLLLLGIGVATVIVKEQQAASSYPRDVVAWVFVLSAIGLLWVRELLNTRLRVRLIGQLHEEATSDPLTGLANRRVLTARIAEVAPADPHCLLALDIDGFKAVNDLLGHTVGDRLLCAVGNRLVRNLPRSALVSRIGGDEFAVLVPGDVADGVAAAEQALAAVRRSCWDVDGVTRLPVSASVGVTAVGIRHRVTPADHPVADHLSAMSAAGAALQLAKAGGRDRIEVFDGTAALMRSRRLSVEERLRAAIEEGGIDVLFQPVVDLATGVITGVEALARWADSRLGPIQPQEFIPIAEQTGLVVELGQLVLDRTLQQATEHRLPDRGIRVACNVSPLQLRVPDFPVQVEQALAMHELPPQTLLVEVTEAVLVDEDGPAVRSLRRLAEAGVTIAIDDFGTGYSALGYLRRLPAHMLKIDRSLTSALVDEPQARAITAAVIDLGCSLGVSIVVEGIETSDVAELVSRMGAGYGQGTLYGSAMPMPEIVRLSRRPSTNRRLA
ncbi:MAG TPA: bifunctional diguanylate cyclase/phosphodiesterase [Kineosporiaceae bacterium]